MELFDALKRKAERVIKEIGAADWVAQNTKKPKVRIVEVDVDTRAYEEGHVPGAIAWAWTTQLLDPVRRDILSKQDFETLLGNSGISNDTTVVRHRVGAGRESGFGGSQLPQLFRKPKSRTGS